VGKGVYAGYSSSGHVYDPMYMGKAKPDCVYRALYTTVQIVARTTP
jgi:hypothetical protein